MPKRFRLSKNQRLELRKDVDLEALERLLATLPQHARPAVLSVFLAFPVRNANRIEWSPPDFERGIGEPLPHSADRRNESDSVNVQRDIYSIRFADPRTQELLEEVFVPALKADPEFARSYRRNQQHWKLCRTPVLLVLKEGAYESNVAALLSYRPHHKRQFAIILSAGDANEFSLNAAFREMLAQFTSGMEEENERLVSVARPADSYLEPRWRNRLSRALEKLRGAPLKDFEGFGMVRTHLFRIDSR